MPLTDAWVWDSWDPCVSNQKAEGSPQHPAVSKATACETMTSQLPQIISSSAGTGYGGARRELHQAVKTDRRADRTEDGESGMGERGVPGPGFPSTRKEGWKDTHPGL